MNKLLTELGDWYKFRHMQRMQQQKNVDGSPFAPLAPATIKQKKKLTGGAKTNATKRMIRYQDFYRKAWEYTIKDNKLIFGISNQPHQFQRVEERRASYETNKAKGWNMKKPKRSHELITYARIAQYNLNSSSDFLGLTDTEYNKEVGAMYKKAIAIVKTNVINEFKKLKF